MNRDGGVTEFCQLVSQTLDTKLCFTKDDRFFKITTLEERSQDLKLVILAVSTDDILLNVIVSLVFDD